jgi:hypothetical protein
MKFCLLKEICLVGEWYVRRNGRISGPITEDKIRELAASGQISNETQVRADVDGPWIQASAVEGLLDAASSISSQPTLAGNSTDVAAHEDGTNDVQDPDAQSGDARDMKAGSVENTRMQDAADVATQSPSASETLTSGEENISVNPYQPASLLAEEQVALPVHPAQGLKTTRTGLLTCYYGICLVLLSGIGVFVIGLGAAGFLAQSSSILTVGVVLVALAGLGSLVGGLAFLVGQVLCLTVPVASGGRRYLKITLSMHVIWLVLSVGLPALAGVAGGLGGMNLLGGEILSGLQLLPQVVGVVFFLRFLKQLALYLGNLELVSAASSVQWWVIGLAVLSVVFPPMVFVLTMSGVFISWFLGVALLVTALVALITFIRFANLILRVARAIPKEVS